MDVNKRYVKKAAGDIEPFSKKKLARFLHRIEVPEAAIESIINFEEANEATNTSTKQIAEHVSEKLRELPNGDLYCARYNLKPAIRKMGPSGHIFEQYIGRIFAADGYNVNVAVEVDGECVRHEIDVFAQKDNQMHIVEAKFHNKEGTRSDMTVALYVYARFLDVSEKFSKPGVTQNVWIATNTKLTSSAFRFAACRGMKVLSVEQPHNNSIMDRVIRDGIFPISTLTELTPYLDKLFREDFVVIKDILHMNSNTAKRVGIRKELLNTVQTKATRILDATRKI